MTANSCSNKGERNRLIELPNCARKKFWFKEDNAFYNKIKIPK